MSDLHPTRLNNGGNETAVEASTNHSRQPLVRHTSDGLEADLPARPDYDLECMTVAEAATGRVVADGGSELEADVYLCGGCESIFAAENACSSYTVEETGEQMDFCTDRCPHCGTEVTNDRTAVTTATFDLTEEGDR